ncbi:MAG TPA: alpha/beta hydrolase [Dongiaceae bacterium]|nr:alpha/beta hydrolase [Dongiaceae bacterium]
MKVLYFGELSRRLFGILDAPANASAGIVFCPPFGEEMMTTYARLACWGKQLADMGIAVLRFHPYGTGESGGHFSDFSVEGALQDTATAINYMRDRIGAKPLGLFGLRFGGFLAAQSAARTPADFVLLWSPVVKLSTYFRELLRTRLAAEAVHLGVQQVSFTTQSMVNEFEAGRSVDILGYEFSPALYRDMAKAFSWPETQATRNVLVLSRSSEQASIGLLPQKWTTGETVTKKVVADLPFWENFSSVFPRGFADSTQSWLDETLTHGINNA